jgi:thiamine biosynthesis lipoprotein
MYLAREREIERDLSLLGTNVRLLIGPSTTWAGSIEAVLDDAERTVEDVHHRLTRFDAGSELSRLNRDPRHEVPVSPLLAEALEAAVAAAEMSGGLVDPTLGGEIERVGYATTRVGAAPQPLAQALAAAPARKPARPQPRAAWRAIEVDARTGVVRRPAGLRVDLGGTAKGLAADRAAKRLTVFASFAVDAGGDLRLGGTAGVPRLVVVENPLTGGVAHELRLAGGAVATSGIGRNLWRTGGGYAHHLLDPATGRAAWTGVVQATALAATAAAAEMIAKSALLSGPDCGAAVLKGASGGVLVLDDGTVEVIGDAL